jgi:NitT/TauT family transport system substrate-binding protein
MRNLASQSLRRLAQRAMNACAAVALASVAMSGTASAEKVVLGQATATTLTFGPVFAAVELGFFKEENIELEHRNFQGASILIPQAPTRA